MLDRKDTILAIPDPVQQIDGLLMEMIKGLEFD